MNTRINISQRKRKAVARNNKVPPQAPAKGLAMSLNHARLTDAKVRASLDQMAKNITIH